MTLNVAHDVSARRLGCDLEWLAANGVRLGGTPAEERAAQYVHDRLEEEGVPCALHEFDAFVSYAADRETFGPARVHVLGDPPESVPARIYAFTGSTDAGPVEGDLVAAGIGSPDDYLKLDAGVDGKVVLTQLSFGLPHSEPARLAQERGAAAVVVANWSDRDGERTHTSTAKWTWGNPTPEDLDASCRIPVVSVSHADGARLLDLAVSGRRRVAVEAHATREWVRTVQPVATIPGRTPEFVLLHCHLDAFGAGVTDNATGMAGLLEVARVLNRRRSELRRSVRLAWWSCHEMPYDGSTWYLDSHWDELRDHCVATLNADSWALAGSRDRPVVLAFAELEDAVRKAVRKVYGDVEIRGGDFDFKEGEQSFWSPGITSAFVFSATPDFPDGPITGPWFHTEHDTIEHVDAVALEQLTRTYVELAYSLCTAETLPFRYSTLARRLITELEELSERAPASLDLEALVDEARALERSARAVEGMGTRPDEGLIQAARLVNPVVYTVQGPYGQDPVAAIYLRRRLPGLRLALDGLEAAQGSELLEPAWLTRALRERNRVADALVGARRILDGPAEARA